MRLFSSSPLMLLAASLALLGGLWVAGHRAVKIAHTPAPPRIEAVAPAGAQAPVSPDAAELARLRSEIKRLRDQLDSTRTSLDETSRALAQTGDELERLRRPLDVDMASSTLRASLAPGEGVVTGGYRLPDGNRLFAFVETDALPDGGVGVASRFFAVPEDIVQTLGLQTLSTEAANTLQHGEVWVRDELIQIADALEKTPGARLLSAGNAAIQPDRPSDVPLPNSPGETPLSLNVRATYDKDRNLDLQLRVESIPAEAQSPETPPAAPEAATAPEASAAP